MANEKTNGEASVAVLSAHAIRSALADLHAGLPLARTVPLEDLTNIVGILG